MGLILVVADTSLQIHVELCGLKIYVRPLGTFKAGVFPLELDLNITLELFWALYVNIDDPSPLQGSRCLYR